MHSWWAATIHQPFGFCTRCTSLTTSDINTNKQRRNTKYASSTPLHTTTTPATPVRHCCAVTQTEATQHNDARRMRGAGGPREQPIRRQQDSYTRAWFLKGHTLKQQLASTHVYTHNTETSTQEGSCFSKGACAPQLSRRSQATRGRNAAARAAVARAHTQARACMQAHRPTAPAIYGSHTQASTHDATQVLFSRRAALSPLLHAPPPVCSRR